jgi:hypothetical protein
MMQRFGGFSERVYASYDEAFPLEPGWHDRSPLYRSCRACAPIPSISLRGRSLPLAMEEEEPAGARSLVPGVERGNARLRRGQNGGVARQRLRGRVREVAEDGEVDVRVDVAERLHLEVREQPQPDVHGRQHALPEQRGRQMNLPSVIEMRFVGM